MCGVCIQAAYLIGSLANDPVLIVSYLADTLTTASGGKGSTLDRGKAGVNGERSETECGVEGDHS